eukprot:359397-Chlamydomonas_euryale.AAC.1
MASAAPRGAGWARGASEKVASAAARGRGGHGEQARRIPGGDERALHSHVGGVGRRDRGCGALQIDLFGIAPGTADSKVQD